MSEDDMTRDELTAYEIVHTIITVIEGASCPEDAEAQARRLLEEHGVDPFSITEGADIVRVDVASPVTLRNGNGQAAGRGV